jgi:hypothetical protein
MRWQRHDIPAALAAWAVSVCALLVIVNPAPALRAALAVLSPLVVLLAFLTSLQSGTCPVCHAPRRRQICAQGDPTVRPASRTSTSQGDVAVTTGWEVDVPIDYACSRCGHARRVVSSRFVDLQTAPTAAEATVLALRELAPASR